MILLFSAAIHAAMATLLLGAIVLSPSPRNQIGFAIATAIACASTIAAALDVALWLSTNWGPM